MASPQIVPRTIPHLRLLRRVGLFFCGVPALFLPFEAGWWKCGELWPVEKVVAAQQREPSALFMRQYFDQQLYRYKFLGIRAHQPQILALGSSRVMKLRHEMFGAEGRKFYNAGGIIQNLEDLNTLLDLCPTLRPRVILLGVDPWWLNPSWISPDHLRTGAFLEATTSAEGHLIALRNQVFEGPRALTLFAQPATPQRIGMFARRHNAGFRADGSDTGGLQAPTTEAGWRFVDREHPTILERIRSGIMRFEPAGGISPDRMRQLRSALEAWKRRGTLVVGFLPPIHSEAVSQLATLPQYRNLWAEYRHDVPALFKELDMPCLDASSPAILGRDDRDMKDGYHAEETFHLYLLRRLLHDSRVRAALPTAGVAVERLLASPRTNYWFPDYEALGAQRAAGVTASPSP